MRTINRVVAGAFVGVGLLAMLEASRLRYYSSLGPGPGFFPLWLGGLLALLALFWAVRLRTEAPAGVPADFWPDRLGALRVGAVLISLGMMAGLIEVIGFRLAMFAMLAFLLLALGRQHPLLTLLIALAGSFGLHFVFTSWLGASLPAATLPPLADLGL